MADNFVFDRPEYSAPIGFWEWNIGTDLCNLTSGCRHIYGFDESGSISMSELRALALPEIVQPLRMR
ncbi:MAG: hypothetical protein IPK16_06445 [Anaerolineales bacterium]|nr:hypothetical protein [Anaerolineales bacterium]